MELTKIVLNKIKELGATKAAAYFGVSVPTIYSWKSKKNPPVNAAQKVFDEITMDCEGKLKLPGEKGCATTQSKFPGPKVNVKKPITEEWILGQPKTVDYVAVQELRKFMSQTNDRFALINEGLVAISHAILRGDARELRFWAMKSTDPDAKTPVTSGINPFKNPESGMVVKSAVEILGTAPVPANLPKNDNWNEPENPAGKRADNWNTPINPVENINRDEAWNKPLDK
jgi:hypothetical protein